MQRFDAILIIVMVVIGLNIIGCSDSSYDKNSKESVFAPKSFYLSEDLLHKYEKMALHGNPDAARKLAEYYLLYENNCEKGNYWNLKAAENGHAIAQLEIGLDYIEDGYGKDKYKMAKYWLQKAAKSGNKDAIEYLRYFFTDKEVKEITIKANRGDADAAYALYKYYHYIDREHKTKQLYWMKKAAALGNKEAQELVDK